MEQGLIDYSLIVMKIDWKGMKKEEKNPHRQLEGIPFYKSRKDKDIGYILGIIDYL